MTLETFQRILVVNQLSFCSVEIGKILNDFYQNESYEIGRFSTQRLQVHVFTTACVIQVVYLSVPLQNQNINLYVLCVKIKDIRSVWLYVVPLNPVFTAVTFLVSQVIYIRNRTGPAISFHSLNHIIHDSFCCYTFFSIYFLLRDPSFTEILKQIAVDVD